MAYTHNELKHKTLAELRDIAKDIDHEALQGYTQLNKEHLVVAMCKALNIDIHEHHDVVLVLIALLIMAVAAGTVLGWSLGDSPAAVVAFVLAYLAGGAGPLWTALHLLRERRLSVDFLMLAAAAGAAYLGDWVEARRRELCDPSRVSEGERRFHIGVVGKSLQCPVELLAAELAPERALPADQGVPAVELVERSQQLTGMRAELIDELGIELRPATGPERMPFQEGLP